MVSRWKGKTMKRSIWKKIPTRDSCYMIAQHGTINQVRACLALFGYGVTKKP